MGDQPSFDVLVIGGGPAGCTAARLLALWGHQVLLRTRPRSAGPVLAESIPPSTRKLFELLGVADAMDAAGFVRSTGNTVWWGSESARIETFAGDNLGWQVTSEQIETILSSAAIDAGVSVDASGSPPGEADAAATRFTLDCTGRSGLFARARRLRVHERDLRTVAMIGRWRARSAFSLPDPTHTVIESYGDGWAWSVPVAAGDRYVAVMVEPGASRLARGQPASRVYHAEIEKTHRFRTLLAEAQLVDGPSGWDASMYSATRYVDGNVLLVGDAGSFIDPLSSAGVKKALASGWLAAIVVHTCLVREAMRRPALDFFSTRESEVYTRFRQMTIGYLAEAAAGHPHPFWNDRTEPDAAIPTVNGQSGDEEARIRAAFERIRSADSLRVRRAAGLCIQRQAAVSGCEIVLEPRLVSREYPAGLRYAFDVDLLALIDLAPDHRQVPDLFDAYNRQCAPVDLPAFLSALATVVAKDWLEWVAD